MGAIQQGVNQFLALGAVGAKFYSDLPQIRAKGFDKEAFQKASTGIQAATEEKDPTRQQEAIISALEEAGESAKKATNLAPTPERQHEANTYTTLANMIKKGMAEKAAQGAMIKKAEYDRQQQSDNFAKQFTEGGRYK